jgi:hypothetical protein
LSKKKYISKLTQKIASSAIPFQDSQHMSIERIITNFKIEEEELKADGILRYSEWDYDLDQENGFASLIQKNLLS